MELVKIIELEQGRYDQVTCEVNGYNSRTRESGKFSTAEEHGCRPIACPQHWKHVKLPSKRVRVIVTFDENLVAQTLATTAARNKSGKAIEYGGLLKARVTS